MSDKEEETAVAEKRGRGRPKKPKSDEPEEPKEKRPRGRPKGSIKTTKKTATPSKGYGKRGRPRKDSSSPTKAEDGSGDN
ncbi:high mobility group protein HMGI-C-like isoform X2 [Mytilus californianus]|uniref:high mobility group protein HMGI-C-like isoform X2 n=1 Tax=Mytilus californianus TaxID=6549 RepID=UPI00224737D8|nr:high mobility group protein HMGI-C-like isoform X2 [Mytilus californianus]